MASRAWIYRVDLQCGFCSLGKQCVSAGPLGSTFLWADPYTFYSYQSLPMSSVWLEVLIVSCNSGLDNLPLRPCIM